MNSIVAVEEVVVKQESIIWIVGDSTSLLGFLDGQSITLLFILFLNLNLTLTQTNPHIQGMGTNGKLTAVGYGPCHWIDQVAHLALTSVLKLGDNKAMLIDENPAKEPLDDLAQLIRKENCMSSHIDIWAFLTAITD